MSSEPTNKPPSDFVWYELHTPDASAALGFYKPVVGWNSQDSGMTDRAYTLLSVKDVQIGGMLEKPATAFADGEKPGWIGYIGVADTEASVAQLLKEGGTVHRATEDIPGVGRFAVVADPQGAVFVLFQPPQAQQQPVRLPPGTPGTAAWHDLAAIEWQPEFAFYASMFGWTKSDAMDMGSSGIYQIFAVGATQAGGMMTRMDPTQPPGWLYYFNVDEIHAAIGRAKEHGGVITHGPSEVPGGLMIAHCLDPQGAIFGMVAPKS
jgi:uncharacterized protein